MNRKPEYVNEGEPERVYFGNVCNLCFSKRNLSKCSRCKEVQYCSKVHQIEDWPFHRQMCALLAKHRTSKKLDKDSKKLEEDSKKLDKDSKKLDEDSKKLDEDSKKLDEDSKKLEEDSPFHRRWSIVQERILRKGKPLTEYERQICMVPWICAVCSNNENLNFGCYKCESVPYCSMEHKRQDEEAHKIICRRLSLCRAYSSLGYQFGPKLKPMDFKYQPIRDKIKYFPKTMAELSKLLQKQVQTPRNNTQAMNCGLFTDRFAAAATFISCLETIGLIDKRIYNRLPNKELNQVPNTITKSRNSNMKLSTPLVIHMVAAYDYELQIDWPSFVRLLLDWIKNVHYIKIILVGMGLYGFKGYDFKKIGHIACYECHPCMYKDVVDKLDPPDVILMHNYGYPNLDSLLEFTEEEEPKKVLFKYSNVPVIITATFPEFLLLMINNYIQSENIELVAELSSNQFSNIMPIRLGARNGLECNFSNNYYAILRRKD